MNYFNGGASSSSAQTMDTFVAEQTSTFYRDPDTGFLMMPGTKRPDGSWRKPRRVREGYVPQDEVPVYESKGKQWAREKASNPIPGLYLGADSGLSAGILNMKIDTFDSSIMLPRAPGIPGLNPDPTDAKKKQQTKKKSASAGSGSGTQAPKAVSESLISKPVAAAAAVDPTDPAKKLRNLRKKLRDIEALEEKLNNKDIANPEPEQLEKVSRKSQVEQEIAALEKSVGLS